jgi:hypothetical protein
MLNKLSRRAVFLGVEIKFPLVTKPKFMRYMSAYKTNIRSQTVAYASATQTFIYIHRPVSGAADKIKCVQTIYLLNVFRPQTSQCTIFAKRHFPIEHLPGYNKNDWISARNLSAYAGIRYHNLFLFFNFLPTIINIHYFHSYFPFYWRFINESVLRKYRQFQFSISSTAGHDKYNYIFKYWLWPEPNCGLQFCYQWIILP